MKTYGIEIREPLVRRMMPPENTSILELSRETGISRSTLNNWKKKARETMATLIPGNGKGSGGNRGASGTPKKSPGDLGGRRGRFISLSDRRIVCTLVEEAQSLGARKAMACKELGISLRTLQRWTEEGPVTEDGRKNAVRSRPSHALSKSSGWKARRRARRHPA